VANLEDKDRYAALLICFDLGMIDLVATRDFLISYTSADRAWAEWIAWQLEVAGYYHTDPSLGFSAGYEFRHRDAEGSGGIQSDVNCSLAAIP
jgi:hypothetical protein